MKHKLIRVLIISIILFFNTASAASTSYYVATWGDNLNDGKSIDFPFSTLTYAVSKIQAGDTVYVTNGTYYNESHIQLIASGNASHRITITSYNGTPIFQNYPCYTCGGPTAYGEAFDFNWHDYITISNLTFRNYDGFNIQIGSDITFDNIIYEDAGAALSLSTGSYGGSHNNTLKNSIIRNAAIDCRGPNQSIYYANTSYGWNSIQLDGMTTVDGYPSSNITISNNKIYDNNLHGLIDLFGAQSDITIRDNELYAGKYTAIYTHGSANVNQVMERIYIYNNTIHDFGSNPVTLSYLHDSLIYNNIFYNIASGQVSLTSTTTDNDVYPDNLTLFNNTIYNASSPMTKMWLWSPGIHEVNIAGETVNHSFSGTSLYYENNISSYSIGGYGKVTIRDTIPNQYTIFVSNNGIADIEYTNNKVFSVSTFSNSLFYTNESEILYYPDKNNFSVQGNNNNVAIFTVKSFPMTACPTTTPTTITVNKFDTTLSQGNVLIDFTANTTDGNNVIFTVNELQPNHYYLIKKDGANFTTTQANSSGSIQFSNSVWSEHTFTIEETSSVDNGDSGEEPSITEFFPVDTTPDQDKGSTYEFNVTVNESLTSSEWYLDGSIIASDTLSLDHTWTHASTHNITFIGSNANGSVSKIWTVNVNDAPVLDSIGAKLTNEGSTLEFTISATDPDSDPLAYSATNLPTGATFDLTTRAFSWTPDETQGGSYEVHFEVTDGSLSDAEDVTITVNSVNHTINKDPILPEYWNYYEGSGSGDWGRTTDEAHSGNYSAFLQGTEYSSDILNIGLVAGDSNGYSGLNAYNATPDTTYNVSFWIKGDFNYISVYAMTWNTEDGSSGRALRSTSIGQVTPTGTWIQYQGTFTTPSDAKKLILMFKVYGDSSQINLGTIYVDDVEVCSSPNIVLNSGAENLEANSEPPLNSIVSITPSTPQTTPGEIFTLTIPITPATPITGAQFDLLFTNSLATVTSVTEGNLLNQDGATTLFNSGTINNAAGTVTDVYGSILGNTSVSSQGSLAMISMTAGSTTGYLNLDLSNVVISDANSAAVPYTLTNATVLIDTAPVLTQIGAKSVDEGSALVFTAGASDADGDSLTYSAANLPAGASFNTATGAFSWTPADGQAGTYVITFEVTDGYLSDSETVTITVNDANHAPVITTFVPANSLTFNELDVITIGIIATDADGDALSYTIKIDGVTKSTSSSYVWETDYSSAGSHTIDIIVSDGIEQVTDQRTITINDVRPRWDVNEDGTVNVLDISIIGQKYGASVGAPYPRWDVNQDGVINVQDMTLAAYHFGETVA